MNSVFAVANNCALNSLRESKFFSTKEKAQVYLKQLADERRYKLGVRCFEYLDDKFSYIFGWEEKMVVFQIVEISVE